MGPPDQSPPGSPGQPQFRPFVLPVPPLVPPVWERQAWESEVEHVAFMAWLTRGKDGPRSAEAAAKYSGLTPEQLHSASLRCVWELRAKEWLAHAREAQREAARPLREAIAPVMSKRLEAARTMVELTALELSKLLVAAQGTPAPTLDPRLLARFMAVLSPVLVDLRRQAEGLPAELAGDDGPDFGALTDEELEQYKRLRDKVQAG